MTGPRSLAIDTRIAQRIIRELTTGCLLWTAGTSDGYGALSVNGRQRRVHRLVYERAYGPVPAGLVVRHHCDVRACIELSHLEAGTRQQNSQEAWDRVRVRVPKPVRFSISLPAFALRELEAIAESRGCSVNAVVREAVLDWLRQFRQKRAAS
jgi:hypothetical protein